MLNICTMFTKQVMDKVNNALANRVTQPQGSELKQQALFILLGPEFTDKHFPYHKYNVKILDTPKIKPRMKEKYVDEMKVFLSKALDQAMKDCRYPDDLNKYNEDNELGHYLQKIRSTFKEGLRKQTDLVLDRQEKDREAKKREAKKNRRKTKGSDSDSSSEDDDDKKNSMMGLYQNMKPSDVCSEALLALLANDDSKKSKYLREIKKHHLGFSIPLRQHFWIDYLKEKEVDHQDINVKEGEDSLPVIQSNFSKKLNKEMKSQKISRAIKSNSWKVIDNSVIETYDNTSSYRLLDNDEHLIQTVRALNIHTVYSKEYSVYCINWLMPLQLAYPLNPDDKEQAHVMKLANFLDMTLRHCKLPIKDVFKIADSIVNKVQLKDEPYYEHICSCLSNQVNRITVKDFPPEIPMKDQKASLRLHAELMKHEGGKMDSEEEEIFTDPTIFVRMWLIQGYSGVVSVNASLWLWDELFLNEWSQKYLINVGLVIFSLLKPWMMRASMYSGARKVFLDEPGKIYLSDLRKSIKHLQGGGGYDEIPENSNYLPPKPEDEKQDDGKKSATKKKKKGKDRSPSPSPPPRKPKAAKPGAANVVLPFAADRLFDVELNLLSDSDDDFDDDFGVAPIPVYEPGPDTPSESEPEPSPEPSPPPTPPPPRNPEEFAWLPYDKSHQASLPQATRVSEPCDLYIDYVRFLPDHISHCKITGRIINMYMSRDKNVPDILAFPDLEGPTRNPSFKFKVCLNKDSDGRQFLNPDMVIILRVYGYENHKKGVAVVGSCLVRIFRSELKPPKLCVGGWQIRVRHGLPNPPGGLEDLAHTDMDENSIIPGVTVCVRLLPASKDYIPAPAYETQYYRSEGSVPTDSEKLLYKHYVNRDDFKTAKVGDHLREMLRLEEEEELPNGPELQRYLENTLDQKTYQKKAKDNHIPNIDSNHFIHYCPKIGVKVNILGVFGLPVTLEGRYCHAYCEVIPGKDSSYESPKSGGVGGYQRFLTKKVDFISAQRSPQWNDEWHVLKPHIDEKAILFIRLFGFQPSYKPGDGTYPGEIKDVKNSYISFKYDSPMAYCFLQLFEKGSVTSGVHWLPLMKGSPDPQLLDLLYKASPAHKVLLLAYKKKLVKYHEGASMEVKLWDAHLEAEDLRDGRVEDQIDGTKQAEKYVKAHKSNFAKSIDEFVLENMPDYIKKDGPIGERFEKERGFFETEANYHFRNAMNEALEAAGKDPLPK